MKQTFRKAAILCAVLNIVAPVAVIIGMEAARMTKRHSGALEMVLLYAIGGARVWIVGTILSLWSDRRKFCAMLNLSYLGGLVLIGLFDTLF